MAVDTWKLRCQAKVAEEAALAEVKDAEVALASTRARYFAAIKAHENAVAANISEARGYPCDHHGYALSNKVQTPLGMRPREERKTHHGS